MHDRKMLRRFLTPDLNRWALLRLFLVALATAVVFTQVLIPFRIEGKNMEPTYRNGTFNFCWRGRYLFSEPARGDVVLIRFAGKQILMLKRIIGLAGDTVEFRNGALFVNNTLVNEPYVHFSSEWNLAPRMVGPGKMYVVDDNRETSLERQNIGQVERVRIVGGVLW
jgi:signal peptidase I, bacterial type